MSERVLIIGLDGAVWSILDPLVAEGRMPNLKRLIDEGAKGPLRTIIPPITVPAWTSFQTGKNPAKHGIFEFLLKKPGSYEEYPISAKSVRARSIWRILSDAGKKVVSLNVPTAYPPEEVNGVMVSGFLTPSKARDFVTPVALLPEIEATFGPYYLYMKTKITGIGMNDEAVRAMLGDCRAMTDYKMKVAVWLAERERPDVLFTHVWSTDRLQHELWDILDPTHPASEPAKVARNAGAVKDFYTYLDGKIGELRAAMGEGVHTFLMSDHGFGPIVKIIDLNWWLYEQGLLVFKTDLGTRWRLWLWRKGLNWGMLFKLLLRAVSRMKPRAERSTPVEELTMFRMGKKQPLLSMADIDWSRTKAYAKTGMGQIILNVAGREPEGCVQPGAEYEAVRADIVRRLRDLVDPETGTAITGEIHLREQAYTGPLVDIAPDITYLPQESGYMATNLTGFMSNRPLVRISGFYGNHTMAGIFVAHGPRVKPGTSVADANILDVAPTVLHLAGLPVPDGMDGRVRTDILDDAFNREHPVRFVPDADHPQAGDARLSEEDEAEVMEKLRGLGYIG